MSICLQAFQTVICVPETPCCVWVTKLNVMNAGDSGSRSTLHLIFRVITYNNKNKVWNFRKASVLSSIRVSVCECMCMCVQSDMESISFIHFTLFDGTNLKSYRRRHHEARHSSTSVWWRTGWTLQFVTCTTRRWHRAPLIRYDTTTGPATSHLHTDNWATLYLTSLTNSWLNSSF